MSKEKEIYDNIYVDYDVIKEVVASIVRTTPGVANVKKFLSKNVNSDNQSKRVITIKENEYKVLEINFSIVVSNGFLVLQVPNTLQSNIVRTIKKHFNINCKVNITVTDSLNEH